MHRNRRVSSNTPIWPMPGRITERARLLSPTRIACGESPLCLLRSRNDATPPAFLLEAGKSDVFAFAFTVSRIRPSRQRPPAVHGGFFEHLLTHFGTPR